MPYGSRLSERELRAIARQRMRDGRLPVVLSKDLIAGYGSGALCCLCEQPIEKHHVEYAVTAAPKGRELVFHLVCHAAWQLECVAIQSGHESGAVL